MSESQDQQATAVDHQPHTVDAPISPPIPSPRENSAEKHGLADATSEDSTDDVKRTKLDSATAADAAIPAVKSMSEATNVPTPRESEFDQPVDIKTEDNNATPADADADVSMVESTTGGDAAAADAAAPVAATDSEKPKSASSDASTADNATSTDDVPKTEEASAVDSTEGAAKEGATDQTPANIPSLTEGSILPEGDYDPPEGSEKGLPKHQMKYAASVLRSVKRLKDASAFLAPVDPVKLNIPTYFDVIQKPMDLGTMEKKLHAGDYESVSQFVGDFELIMLNCMTFNGNDSFISGMARNVKGSFIKHMAHMPFYNQPDAPKAAPKRKSLAPVDNSVKSQRAAAQVANALFTGDSDSPSFALQPSGIPTIRRESMVTEGGRPKREIHPPKPRDLPYGDVKPRKKKYAAELKFCGQVLKELTNRKYESFSYPFLLPVDPVALGCPSYFKIIKQPMDLSTIQEKYNTNQYETADDFASDVKLMFKNCYKFNPDGSPVNLMGRKLEAIFDKKWLEKPLPAPSPPPQSRDSDSEFSDDEDYDEVGITNPAIKFLEEQIDRMQAELNKLKKEAAREYREQRRKSAPAASRKRKSTNGGRRDKGDKRKSDRSASLTGMASGPTHVTYEMKVKMSEMIGNLPEKKLRHVVQIIQESMPHLRNTAEDEIELDLEKIDPHTLLKLYNFVVRDNGEKKPARLSGGAAGAGAAPGQKRRKSKPLTEDEQSKEIESLQQKLREFDNMQNGGNSQSPPAAATAAVQDSSDDSSDDDSDDSSSSEEE